MLTPLSRAKGTPTTDLDLVVDTFFCLEIFFTFFIGRHVKGKLVTRLDGVAADYIKSGQVYIWPASMSGLGTSVKSLPFTSLDLCLTGFRNAQLPFDLCTSVPVSWIEFLSR